MSYAWPGMKKITYEEAMEAIGSTLVYLLYDDDSESMVDDEEELAIQRIKDHHEYGGEYGIELDEDVMVEALTNYIKENIHYIYDINELNDIIVKIQYNKDNWDFL